MWNQRKLYQFVGLTAIGAGIASSLAFAIPARAGLEFCNRSKYGKAYVAVAYPDGKNSWRTQGWLNLEKGECNTIIEGDLINRYYYYYAETDNDYVWKGETKFCVSRDQFTFTNASKQCRGIRSRWENFRQLDTGRDATDYTLDLK